MPEHISEQEGGLNMGNVSNKVSEVTAEELGNVATSLAKGQAIGGQIRDDQRKNSNTSKFLTYLLLNLKDDELRSMLDVFVRYVDIPDSNQDNSKNLDTKPKHMLLMTDEIVGLFLPFYQDIADEFDIQTQYPLDYHIQERDVIQYTDYINQLILQYPELKNIEAKLFVKLIIKIMEYFIVIDQHKMSTEAGSKLEDTLSKKFFGLA